MQKSLTKLREHTVEGSIFLPNSAIWHFVDYAKVGDGAQVDVIEYYSRLKYYDVRRANNNKTSAVFEIP